MKIEVITSITGDKDTLHDPVDPGNATFTVFTDQSINSKIWTVKKSYDGFVDSRRNSRIHKLLMHKYSDADIMIWHDGNKQLLVSPEKLVETYLQDYDIAIFSHVMRDCLYDEAMTCAKLHLDDPEKIIEQAKYYEDHGWAKHKGLCEGGFSIRRRNARTIAFEEAWWADYCRFSRRDQLSLMPALEKSKARVNFLFERYVQGEGESVLREGRLIQMYPHNNFEGNFNGPQTK